ncbi:uncharacterized protein CBL_03336 [Carabus blaptoides fortunei]
MTLHSGQKFSEARVLDYLYDPIFTLPTKKDHARYAMQAAFASAQCDYCPIFPCMFSDLPHYPRQKIVLRRNPHIPPHIDTKWKRQSKYDPPLTRKGAEHIGADMVKFIKCPIVKLSVSLIPDQLLSQSPMRTKAESIDSNTPKNRSTQTMYRESSAQTSPWKSPDYIKMDHPDPEILKLNFLKENLPAGIHEIEIIKRARKKRAWEKIMPVVEDAASLEQRRLILEAIERDEWAYREEEIREIQKLRLELLEKMLQEILDISANRTEQKLTRLAERLNNKREKMLDQLYRKKERELRRLNRERLGIKTRLTKVGVYEEYMEPASEYHGPTMRYGAYPKYWNELIDPDGFKTDLTDIGKIDYLPKSLTTNMKFEPVKILGGNICSKMSKWTEPILKQIYEDLMNMETKTKAVCNLRKRIVKEEEIDETMRVDAIEEDIKLNEACLLLQSVIRGRATQTLIYEGRDRCRELIQELQTTHTLVINENNDAKTRRLEVLNQQRVSQIAIQREENLEEILNKLQGTVVGTLLDFLNKELVRLLDERKAHAMALLYERERRDKEAAEAGRRQVEIRRRKEHDEMFKQIVKIHQETVDIYLRDIILEGIEITSEEDANKYVERLAQKIDEDVKQEPQCFNEKEELIADMIYNFVIPEVEKQRVREKIKQRQHIYLRTVHNTIFNKIETLPKLSDDISESELEESYEVNETKHN